MQKSPPEIMKEMAKTFQERANLYGDNYERIGYVLEAFFPNGFEIKGAYDWNLFHLWFLILVKMTRLAVTGFNHQDSIHDIAVYAAMYESLLTAGTTPTSETARPKYSEPDRSM